MKRIDKIRTISNYICDNAAEALRLEEEMLYMFVKSTKHGLAEKKIAFSRLEQINKEQLRILGSKIKDY